MEMTMFNRYLKEGKAKGFDNVFYIVQCPYTSYEWWQLMLRDTHQVISTSPTKDGILANVEMMVKKYKTPDNIYSAMSKTDYQLNPTTIQQRKELAKEYEFMLPEINRVANKAVQGTNEKSVPMKIKFKRVTPIQTLAF